MPPRPESKRETEARGGGSVESDRQGPCFCKQCHQEQHLGNGSERDTADLLPTPGTQLGPNSSSLWFQPFSPRPLPRWGGHQIFQISKLQGVCAASSCQLRCFFSVAPFEAHPLDQRYLGRRRSPSITSRSLDRGRIFAFKPNSCKSSVLPINSLIFSSIHSPAPRPKHTEAEQHTKSSPNHCCSYGNSSSSSYSSPIMFSDKTTKYKLI